MVLSQRLLDFVTAEKDADIRASLPEILRRALLLGVIGERERIDRSSLWRACVRMNVPVVRRKKAKVRDSHRFAYPHRMDLNLCDGKHFRAGVSVPDAWRCFSSMTRSRRCQVRRGIGDTGDP